MCTEGAQCPYLPAGGRRKMNDWKLETTVFSKAAKSKDIKGQELLDGFELKIDEYSIFTDV